MTENERRDVRDDIENEGFDYAFRYHCDFADVKDEKFHQLRLAYVEAANTLENYIGKEPTHD